MYQETMNSRIEKDYCFLGALHFNNKFYMNNFDITVSMLVETENVYEQGIAILRSAHLIENILQNCVFVNATEKLAIDKYKNANLKTCELPDEPHDQLIASMILLKLNAIMENKLRITDMLLSSYLSEGIRYNIVAEVAEAMYPENAWYNKSCTSINEQKILKLFENKWLEIGLDWKER